VASPPTSASTFLGDAVLGVVVTEHLYLSFPDEPEGILAKLRAAVVNAQSLATVARSLDLGRELLLGRGEATTGGRDKASILADTLEAVIGAVFLQHGIAAAGKFVHRLFDAVVEDAAMLGAASTGRPASKNCRPRCPSAYPPIR